MAAAVFNPEGIQGSAVEFFLMGLGVPLFIWFVARWLLHGSITLDNIKNVLEFSESWNLKTPELVVKKENIDQVKMKWYSPGAGNPASPAGGGGYRLVLCYRERRKNEQRVLNLFFPDYKDAKKAGILIGKFADKAVYDHNGEKIFPESS